MTVGGRCDRREYFNADQLSRFSRPLGCVLGSAGAFQGAYGVSLMVGCVRHRRVAWLGKTASRVDDGIVRNHHDRGHSSISLLMLESNVNKQDRD